MFSNQYSSGGLLTPFDGVTRLWLERQNNHARGVDFRIGLGVAWSKEDPTAASDDIIDIARSLVRVGR